MKKIILLLSLCFLITGCSQVKQANNVAAAIVKLHQEENYIGNLSNSEKQTLKEFQASQTVSEKEINLSAMNIFFEGNETDEPDSPGIYKKGNDYYIKYEDLYFIPMNESEIEIPRIVYVADLVCNGYYINVFKYLVPVLYQDTKNDPLYDFRYLRTEDYDDHIDIIYRSLKDSTFKLRVRFIIENNKIESIDTWYGFMQDDSTNNIDNSKRGSATVTIILTGLLIAAVAGVVFTFIRIKNANE